MNESELKDLFVSSLESGHIFDNKSRNLSFTNPDNEIRIKVKATSDILTW
jgi:hypothetical protein